MTLLRRNPLQSAVGALLAVGLLVSGIVASTGGFQNAATSCTGYGFQNGYGYGYGYDNQFGYGCPPPTVTPASNRFAEGTVFVVQPGQKLTLSGSTGVPNVDGAIVIDSGDTTAANRNQDDGAVSTDKGSQPQEQVIGDFHTDDRGNFTVTVTIPPDLSFGRHAISALINNTSSSAAIRSSNLHSAAVQEVVRAVLIAVPDLKGDGYRLVAGDGGSFNFGNNFFHGSVPDPSHLNGKLPNKPVVGGDNTVSNQGYWMVASDGGMFAGFGDSVFYGSLPDPKHLNGKLPNKPIVGMVRTPTGNGYWMVASDGGVFNFGDAGFFGSLPDPQHLNGKLPNSPIIGMAATPSGNGYWMAAADGGVFTFGDAQFF